MRRLGPKAQWMFVQKSRFRERPEFEPEPEPEPEPWSGGDSEEHEAEDPQNLRSMILFGLHTSFHLSLSLSFSLFLLLAHIESIKLTREL